MSVQGSSTAFLVSYGALWILLLVTALLVFLLYRHFGLMSLATSDAISRDGLPLGEQAPALTGVDAAATRSRGNPKWSGRHSCFLLPAGASRAATWCRTSNDSSRQRKLDRFPWGRSPSSPARKRQQPRSSRRMDQPSHAWLMTAQAPLVRIGFALRRSDASSAAMDGSQRRACAAIHTAFAKCWNSADSPRLQRRSRFVATG